MERILLVEDDCALAMGLVYSIQQEGFEVTHCPDAKSAREAFASSPFDLALLDVMLPDMTGFDLCRRIRETHMFPIVMLTAKVEDMDKITGLTLGADDYMTKPFNPLELVARVKTQLRRYTTYNVAAESRKQIYDFAGLYICRDNRKCSLYGRELALTPLEFDILWYLCEHKGTVVSSEVLFEAVWGEKYLDNNNTVMAHIARLREKMGEPSRKPRFIKTVWGVGYTIE